MQHERGNEKNEAKKEKGMQGEKHLHNTCWREKTERSQVRDGTGDRELSDKTAALRVFFRSKRPLFLLSSFIIFICSSCFSVRKIPCCCSVTRKTQKLGSIFRDETFQEGLQQCRLEGCSFAIVSHLLEHGRITNLLYVL